MFKNALFLVILLTFSHQGFTEEQFEIMIKGGEKVKRVVNEVAKDF